VPRFESEDLGSPFPPSRLELNVRETQDAFHRVRPYELVSPQSNLIAKSIMMTRETCAPNSPSLHRPPSSGVSSEGSVSFWLGTCCCSRRVALQRHAGQAPSIRPSDECHSNFSSTSTRTRWFPVHPRDLHLVWRDRVWDLPLGRGRRRFHDASSASASLHPKSVHSLAASGVFSPQGMMPPTSDIRVASPAPVLVGPRAFARALVGKSRQDQFHRLSVTSDDFPDRDAFHRQGPFRISGEIPTNAFTL